MEKSGYNPKEPVTVTMVLEQWETVLRYLQYCADYHDAKKWEWLADCKDKKLAGQIAAQHEKQSMEAAAIYKIIAETVYPEPETETETAMEKSENVCAFEP